MSDTAKPTPLAIIEDEAAKHGLKFTSMNSGRTFLLGFVIGREWATLIGDEEKLRSFVRLYCGGRR